MATAPFTKVEPSPPEVYSQTPVRIRLSLAILLTLLLAANVFVPTLCAAHCSPTKTPSHHHATFAQEKSVSMCEDCSQNFPQLHAFTCPNATQIDTRTEPSFALTIQQSTANSVLLRNFLGNDHKISIAENVPQQQPTLSPQNLVATASPLRL
jgi:hypothetical protein